MSSPKCRTVWQPIGNSIKKGYFGFVILSWLDGVEIVILADELPTTPLLILTHHIAILSTPIQYLIQQVASQSPKYGLDQKSEPQFIHIYMEDYPNIRSILNFHVGTFLTSDINSTEYPS